jgi:valyl-tRNA synthetase
MPFITETLWRRFPGRPDAASISVAPWPGPDERATDQAALEQFEWIQELVRAVRSIRAEYGVQPGQTVRVTLGSLSATGRQALAADEATVRRLAKVSAVAIEEGDQAGDAAGHAVLGDGTSVSVPLGDLIDVERECARLSSELTRLEGQLQGLAAKLGNEQFVSKAPAAVVEREREKLASWQDQAAALRQKRAQLGCTG